MAAREIYLKSSNPSRLFFRNSNDVEISVIGSTVSATAAAGEIYVRIISGIPYFYWSVNGSTVYRTPTDDLGNSSEAQGSLWVSSGGVNLLNVAVNNRRWAVPTTTTTTTTDSPFGIFAGYTFVNAPTSTFPNRVIVRRREAFGEVSCQDFNEQTCQHGANLFGEIIQVGGCPASFSQFECLPAPTTTTTTASGGCFAGETLILTPNKGYVPINTINPGDKVLSYNKFENKVFESEVKYVFIHDGIKDYYHPFDTYPMLKITYEINGVEDFIYVTSNHPILKSETLTFDKAETLTIGDNLSSPYGNAVVNNIEITEKNEVVYTLDVTDQDFTDNYIVQGLVAANDKV